MAKLVRQRGYGAERAIEIGQHVGTLNRVNAAAERTALLSLARVGIDQTFIERARHHLGDRRIARGEYAHQQIARFFERIGFGIVSDGREQILKFQPAFVAQRAVFQTEIAAEHRHGFAHRAHQRIQRFAIHARFGERPIQHGIIMLQLRDGVGFGLDAVQTRRHRGFNAGIGGDFRLVARFAHLGTRIVRQRTHRCERQTLRFAIDAYIHRKPRKQLVAQAHPRLTAAQTHFQHHGFQHGIDQMRGGFLRVAEEQSMRAQQRIRIAARFDAVILRDARGEAAEHQIQFVIQLQAAGSLRDRRRAVGIRRQRKEDHRTQLFRSILRIADQFDQRMQIFAEIAFVDRIDPAVCRRSLFRKHLHIRFKRRIFKSVVQLR